MSDRQPANVEEAGYAFVIPDSYADEEFFYRACAMLREQDPVHWVNGEGLGFNSFWAITRSADIFDIEARNKIFLNEPRPVLSDLESDRRRAEDGDLMIIDGEGGLVHIRPEVEMVSSFQARVAISEQTQAELSRLRDEPATTTDGATGNTYSMS